MRDPESAYGRVSIWLHWIGAIVIVVMFLTGERMEDMDRGPERADALWLHLSLGSVAFILLGTRILWRLFNGKPKLLSSHPILDKVANAVFYALLLSMAVAIISGPLAQWSGGRSLFVFGLFEVASPMGRIGWLHEAMEEVHEIATHAFIPLVGLHLLGVVKHIFLDGDGTMHRMISPPKSEDQPS